VTLKSYTPKPGNNAEVVVAFDDLTALSTAEGFENVQVTKNRDGDDEIVKIVIKNTFPKPDSKDEGRPPARMSITFPGKVKEANRNAEVADRKVTWNIPLVDIVHNPSIDFTARYAAPGATTTTTSSTEPPKAGTKSTTTTVPPKGKKAPAKKKS
jgi:hypothetical protein